MAVCFRCDRCGKIMEDIPIKEQPRKSVCMGVTTICKGESDDKPEVVSRSIYKDLCADCCFGLETVIFKYMEEKGENNEEKAIR